MSSTNMYLLPILPICDFLLLTRMNLRPALTRSSQTILFGPRIARRTLTIKFVWTFTFVRTFFSHLPLTTECNPAWSHFTTHLDSLYCDWCRSRLPVYTLKVKHCQIWRRDLDEIRILSKALYWLNDKSGLDFGQKNSKYEKNQKSYFVQTKINVKLVLQTTKSPSHRWTEEHLLRHVINYWLIFKCKWPKMDGLIAQYFYTFLFLLYYIMVMVVKF